MDTETSERILDLRWKAQAGVFYHQDFSRFYERWLRASSFLSLFFALATAGSVAFEQLFSDAESQRDLKILSLTLVVLLAANQASVIAFDVANLVSRHKDLARDWLQSLWEIEECLEKERLGIESANVLRIAKRQSEIDEREPPTDSERSKLAGDKAAHILGLQKPDNFEAPKTTGY